LNFGEKRLTCKYFKIPPSPRPYPSGRGRTTLALATQSMGGLLSGILALLKALIFFRTILGCDDAENKHKQDACATLCGTSLQAGILCYSIR